MSDSDDLIKALTERVERLERQVAVLMKRTGATPSRNRSQEMRDRYDSLDYPER